MMRKLTAIVLCLVAAAAGAKFFGIQKNVHYKVDLMVRGEPVNLDRVVHCSPFLGGEISNPFDIYHQADRAALTRRLASGEGVIVVLPNYCFHHLPIPSDFIPLIALVDDADAPRRIELYVSGVRLTSPENPVQLVRFEAEIGGLRIGGGGDAGEFAAWEVLGSRVATVHNPAGFLALYGLAVEGEIEGERPALVRSNAAAAAWLNRHRNYHVRALMDGSFSDPPSALGRTPGMDPGYDIVPFVRDESGALIAEPESRGMIVFYRNEQTQGPWKPRVSADGLVFEVEDLLSSTLQLPGARMLLALKPGSQRLGLGN